VTETNDTLTMPPTMTRARKRPSILLDPAPSDLSEDSLHGPDRAGEPVTVTGDGQKRKLMFARKGGELHFITLEESFGERTASLSVESTASDLDGALWHLALNRKPFLAFANQSHAMQTYDAACAILNDAFADDRASQLKGRHRPEVPARDAAKDRSEWLQTLRIVGSIIALVVLGVFAGSMALRIASHVVPWKGDQGVPKALVSSPIAAGRSSGASQ